MFDETGHLRESKTKSNLKNDLRVDAPNTDSESVAYATFLDGCAVLWFIAWPSGTVQDYINIFVSYFTGQLIQSDVYLVFDRYDRSSTKESTRTGRDKGASRIFILKPTTRLPSQKVILTVKSNKSQLVNLICSDITSKPDLFSNTTHKLVVTGQDPVPFEIHNGILIWRQDMRSTEEEADTLIVQQVSHVAARSSLFIADDTDIFVLLLHFCHLSKLSGHIMMVAPAKGRTVIDISQTYEKHSDIVPNLLSMHGLTGCDSVAGYFGIGKCTAHLMRRGNHSLGYLGAHEMQMDAVFKGVIPFILECYGFPQCDATTDARRKMWSAKVGRSMAFAPKLNSLPPTNEACAENVKRANLQVCVWRHALDADPTQLNPADFDWSREDGVWSPVTVPDCISVEPMNILKLIRCSCATDTPCSTKRCGCTRSNLPSTKLCSCQGSENCFNSLSGQNEAIENDVG